jgi:tRNA G37 N-methylase TrmD
MPAREGGTMRVDVVTLFPELVDHAVRFGVTGRALARGLWQIGLWNPRDYATDNHRTVDDRPYGGGPGMVMLGDPLAQALAAARRAQRAAGVEVTRTIHLSPGGSRNWRQTPTGRAASCSPGGTKGSTSGCSRARSTRKSPLATLSSPAASCRR